MTESPEDGCVLPPRALSQLRRLGCTPCFIYDEAGLRAAVGRVREAFFAFGRILVRFPIRMNPEPELLSILKSEGCGVECQNRAELLLAQKLGFAGQQVVYAPMLADMDAAELAAQMDAVWTADALHVLPLRPQKRLLLRLSLARTTPSVHAPHHGGASRFGMEPETLLSVAERIAGWRDTEVGLTVQLAEQGNGIDAYARAAAQMAQCARLLTEKTGRHVAWMDFGGGLDVSCRAGAEQFDVRACALEIGKALHDCLNDTELSLSAGRYLTANSGLLAATVRAIKHGGAEPLAILDLPGPRLMHLQIPGTFHTVTAPERADTPYHLYSLTGCSAGMYDCVLRRRLLPELRIGSVVLILGVGADGAALSSGYGMFPPCASLLYDRDKRLRVLSSGV